MIRIFLLISLLFGTVASAAETERASNSARLPRYSKVYTVDLNEVSIRFGGALSGGEEACRQSVASMLGVSSASTPFRFRFRIFAHRQKGFYGIFPTGERIDGQITGLHSFRLSSLRRPTMAIIRGIEIAATNITQRAADITVRAQNTQFSFNTCEIEFLGVARRSSR